MSQIELYVGDDQITASSCEVRVDPAAKHKALALVELARGVPTPVDDDTYNEGLQVAAQIKAFLDQVEADRKSAKTPFTAIGRSIDGAASGLSNPVQGAHSRLLASLTVYVGQLKAAREKEEKAKAEQARIKREQDDRRLAEAQEAARKAQEALRAAQDETERVTLRAAATERENKLLREQLEQELAADVAGLGYAPEKPPGLVPGGRVTDHYDFELINVQATCEARCYRLLRWELDIPACRDSIKSQLEGMPEIEPSLPGIKITKRLNVSVKGASRITS